MKRVLILLMILVLLIHTTVSASSLEDIMIGEENEISRAVASINDGRSAIGLEPFIISETLNDMALTHSKYQHYNDTLGSVEESDMLYFRGRYPWDRADYFQYNKNFVYEFVGDTYDNYLHGYTTILNNPLTRPVLLNPMYEDIGMGTFEEKYTYVLGGNAYEGVEGIVYPYDGQHQVPVKYTGDIVDMINVDPNVGIEASGLPITYTHYGKDIDKFILDIVYLRKTGDIDAVNAKILEPGYLPQMKNTVTVVPMAPLQYGTEYTLSLKFDLEFEDDTKETINKTISFTTVDAITQTMAVKFVTRENFTEVIMKNEHLHFDLIEPLEMKFSDVDIKSNNSIYIHTASELGIINGYPDGTFGPEWNITKQQAYKILIEAYEQKLLDEEDPLPPIVMTEEAETLSRYTDTYSVASWARSSVEKADALGIIVDNNGEINPTEFITEPEFDLMMTRFNLKVKALETRSNY